MKLNRLFVISTFNRLANKKIFPLKSLNKDLVPKRKTENFNFCIGEGKFPSELKHADIVPIHKKNSKSDKSNYRPLSILSFQYFENMRYFQGNKDFEKDIVRSIVF